VLALQLAWRFLREGRTQSLLILAGVTIGIAAFVFVSALIEGLQINLLEQTLGSQAHLSVAPEEAPPRPLMDESGVAFARRIEPSEPRRRPFDQWQRAVRRVEATDGVVAVCPKASGSALAYRGAAEEAVYAAEFLPEAEGLHTVYAYLFDGIRRVGRRTEHVLVRES